MDKTHGSITPGGRPDTLENPPSNMEVGPKDSGEDQLSLQENPFMRRSALTRTPPGAAGSGKHTAERNDVVVAKNVEKNIGEENADLRNKLTVMEGMLTQLQAQVSRLMQENVELKTALGKMRQTNETNMCGSENTDRAKIYETDEEELERETDWIIKTNKRKTKKRKAESSPEASAEIHLALKQSTSSENHVVQKHEEIKEMGGRRKEVPPPPINVVGMSHFAEVKALLSSVPSSKYKIIALSNNVWRLLMSDSDTYRAMVSKLTKEKVQWYTYEDKNCRPVKVMARGLHPTCEKEDILADLQEKGFKIIDAVNILKKDRNTTGDSNQTACRVGLPLFMLTFDRGEKLENIYNITGILNMKVKIEPLRKTSELIPQCKRCQGFNHTQRYCARDPRCVKCTGKHLTRNCTVDRSVPPTCVNCKEQHPANYRGCEVAKELQKMRNLRKKTGNKRTEITNRQVVEGAPVVHQIPSQVSVTVDNNKSKSKIYAGAAKKLQTKLIEKKGDHMLQEVLDKLNSLNKRMEEQKETNKKIVDKITKQGDTNKLMSQRLATIESNMENLSREVGLLKI